MPEATIGMSEETFRLISGLMASYCGLQFDIERAQSVASRLAPRLEETHCYSFQDYYHLLKYDGVHEIKNAVELLTNHETYFFREVGQLEFVTQMAARAAGTFRVLSAGSSSGEEPYSLSMLLQDGGVRVPVDLVGIDISHRVIERARVGAYTANSFRGVDGAVVERHFKAVDGHMHLSPVIRDSVVFDRVNLMDVEDLTQLGTFDVVLCRNVLIYFSRASKARVIAGLSSVLRPGGYLFLGHSESLFDVPHQLEMVRAGAVIGHRRPVVTS